MSLDFYMKTILQNCSLYKIRLNVFGVFLFLISLKHYSLITIEAYKYIICLIKCFKFTILITTLKLHLQY